MGSIGIGARQSAAGFSIALHALLLALLFTLPRPRDSADDLIERPFRVALQPLVPPPELTPVQKQMGVAPAEEAKDRPTSDHSAVTSTARPAPIVTIDIAAPTMPSTTSTAIEAPGANALNGKESGPEAASGTEGQAAGAHESRLDSPDWIVKPTGDQMAGALPHGLRQARISGAASLSCLVTPHNRARACKVLTETQGSYAFGESYEFGKAALRLSRHFRIRAPVRDGSPRYDIRVRIPIYWDAK